MKLNITHCNRKNVNTSKQTKSKIQPKPACACVTEHLQVLIIRLIPFVKYFFFLYNSLCNLLYNMFSTSTNSYSDWVRIIPSSHSTPGEEEGKKKNGSQSGAGSLRWRQKALRTGSFIIDEHLLPPKTRLAAAEALMTFKLLEESGSKNQLRFHGLWSYSREMAKKGKCVLRPKLCYKSLKGGQWCGNP